MKSELDLQRLARQWGATTVPFSQGPEWLDTPATRNAVERLQQTAVLRSVLLLAGPNGVGKSALVGRWLRGLDSRLFCPVPLTQATLTGSSILATLAAKLGKPSTFRRERNLQLIEQALSELERRLLVVVLDEAQNYSHSALEELRLLLGLNLAEAPAFGLVLIGDDYLLRTLQLQHHRALYSRLACQLRLEPWSLTQAAQYVETALVAVGLSKTVIESSALELLTKASGGVARSLCLLARAAWLAAATDGSQKILAAHAQKAIEQVPYAPGLLQPAMAAQESAS
jgi:type II secretory pathway predicted ATPase ExeA